jgi:hypothetical protein
MCKRRAAMATTRRVAVREREKGFAGRGMMAGSCGFWVRKWKCRVQSQEEDIRRAAKRSVFLYEADRGRELTVLFAVDNSVDWCSMRTQDCLLASLQINPIQHTQHVFHSKLSAVNILLDLPIHARCEGLIVILSKADIQNRSSMFIFL